MVSVRLVFGLENTPSANFMSATSTLSRWAAICFALVTILLAPRAGTAEPPIVAEREPPVPSPTNT